MRSRCIILFLGLLICLPGFAQTSFPMITHATPLAVQQGTSAELTIHGKMNFAGAYEVLVEGDGVTAKVVPESAKGKDEKATVTNIKLKVTVAKEAMPGVREFRVATPQGVSTLGQLLITQDPVVEEKPGTNVPQKAQPVEVPCVISGRIEKAEDVDYYKVTAKKGQILTMEVFGARLQDKIHDLQKHLDPMVTVYDSTGRELAANDDAFFADPMLTFPVPRDGEYLIQVRDARFDGDPRWAYALAITNKPYSAINFPLAANPGKSVEIEPFGSARLASTKMTVNAPSDPGIHQVQVPIGRLGLMNPTPMVVTTVPLANEVEPNDTPKQANELPVPGGINGRIQEARDLDHYLFQGKKGKPVRLEVYARRFGTPLHSPTDIYMDIMDKSEKILASNDDVNGKDPMLIFNPPADGEYFVRLRDLNNKGGNAYVYFLEADYVKPDFSVKCDPSKIQVGPGSRSAMFVQVKREGGFKGPVQIDVENLPDGVTVNPLTIPANMTTGCLVLSAASNAKHATSEIFVIGSAQLKDEKGQNTKVSRYAVPEEEIYFPGGGRGLFDVNMVAVSVTDPSDILEVQVKPAKIVLKPGQEVKIDVNLKRRDDFDKGVTLDMKLKHLNRVYADPLPPGVTMVDGKSKTLLGTGNSGHIVLKAAADAPECTDVPVCIQGFVSINFVVKVGYASEPILISVKK